MKIFAMNDCDWYAGATAEDALKAMAENLDFSDVEECRKEYCTDGQIVELSEEALDGSIYVEEDDADGPGSGVVRRTFRQQLKQMLANGETFPTFFATTEK